MNNIFADLPDTLTDEVFQTLAENHGVRIERIISQGQSTPEGEWYDQEWDEWVMLLSGEAELLFEENDIPIRMKPGDYIMIPSRQRHRVTWTAPETQSVWLAVHLAVSSVNS